MSALKTLTMQPQEALVIINTEPIFPTPGVLRTLLLKRPPAPVCSRCFSFPSLLRPLLVVLFLNSGTFHSRGQNTDKGSIHQLCLDDGCIQMVSNHPRDPVVHFGEAGELAGEGGRLASPPNQGRGTGSQQPGAERNLAVSQHQELDQISTGPSEARCRCSLQSDTRGSCSQMHLCRGDWVRVGSIVRARLSADR